ncbi:flavin reductase family protein [Humibacter ginsenosidimutans]|uniref:Flavin reductase family protein n=1 Tax=Humibacter ginsenosidimutans TaxID=2599293 RepID=A0A5B8M2V5_9MICO|nr:flavin reductase family protein [Humibacter ginsenosidimutans]QDZ14927.1 flavin reductase family protein [Humibacter ginsenosidimutans]
MTATEPLTTRASETRHGAPELTSVAGSGPGSAVDAQAFKDAFRLHPAGVALITAMTPEGPVGLTASSVASVGIDPAALAFSVTRATGSAGGILGAPTHVVHLLDAQHVDLAQVFARSGTDRFTPEQGWSSLPTGEPHLAGARVALRCRILQTTAVGSSVLVLSQVLDIYQGEFGDPVAYVDREFRRLG